MADASGLEQFAVFFISFTRNTYYHCCETSYDFVDRIRHGHIHAPFPAADASAAWLVYDYLTTLDDEVCALCLSQSHPLINTGHGMIDPPWTAG